MSVEYETRYKYNGNTRRGGRACLRMVLSESKLVLVNLISRSEAQSITTVFPLYFSITKKYEKIIHTPPSPTA